MEKDLHHFMQVGLIHFMAYPAVMKGEGPVLETIRKIALDDYFDVVEITWIKDPETRKQARKILETAGMTITYGGQPRLLISGLNINDLDEAGRLAAVRTLKEGIDEAYEMGATGFAFLSGHYEEARKDEAFYALLASTRELCEYAGSKGNLRVVHEIFDYDVDKKSLVGPAGLAREYAREICKDYGNFGLMADLSHLPLIHETAEEAIMPIREYLVHAHLGNCVVRDSDMPAYGDAHPRFGFPGSENDLENVVEFLRVLLKIGFLNERHPPVVSFEVKPFGDEDPDLVVVNAKRMLNKAWSVL